MEFTFRPMNEAYADAIAHWHYEGALGFYDMDQDPEDLRELLDPDNWRDKYHAVLDEGGELIGFFCFEVEGDAVTLGLGLRPDCTGRGLGQAFVEAGLDFARRKYDPAVFRLSVATFNARAIRVYEKAGFERGEVYMGESNGRWHEFLRMARQA